MSEPSTDPAEQTDLNIEGQRLLGDARTSSQGRAAHTVVHGDLLRATLIGIIAGKGLDEHEAPPAATLHVLQGRARLVASESGAEWTLTAGHVVAVPRERHRVDVEEDALLFLTVCLGHTTSP